MSADFCLLAAAVLLPFLGTTLGAFIVFFLKKELNLSVQKGFLGFASGVMIAASVWSLILPALEMSAHCFLPWLPAVSGFLLGVGFLLLLDVVIPHMHPGSRHPEGCRTRLRRSTMLMLAVTLHNLPEGMAVGVVLAGSLSGQSGITLAAALILSLGIALQNFPEGAIISMPLFAQGAGRRRSFFCGALSGLVEPLGAVLTLLLSEFFQPALPYILCFAAGAMYYVVVEELIPEFQAGVHTNAGTLGAAAGFALMMILDVALG